jgi:hypothetical protein
MIELTKEGLLGCRMIYAVVAASAACKVDHIWNVGGDSLHVVLQELFLGWVDFGEAARRSC